MMDPKTKYYTVDHVICPLCYSKDVDRTSDKVTRFPGEEFVDIRNEAFCLTCEWRGTPHDLLPNEDGK